ncbi:MAG: histidine phosphatase family protein [Synergistaceae bacterium]|jgi:probable phosphoglycerate mutase|nr:histidine phosphatase family protein [Synergistaceae bacterium]
MFIVRHGETYWNLEGRFQGQKDAELAPRGVEQGERVAQYLSPHRFDAVITSPLQRSSVTAERIAESCGCETFEVMDELTEICHGDWETRLTNEVIDAWPRLFDLWHTQPHTVVMPGDGGESLRDVQIRVLKAADAIVKKYSGDVCLVTHDVPIKTLLCHYLNAPLSSFWNFLIANCSLTIVELRENLPPRVNLMGDAHYLGLGFDLPEQKSL